MMWAIYVITLAWLWVACLFSDGRGDAWNQKKLGNNEINFKWPRFPLKICIPRPRKFRVPEPITSFIQIDFRTLQSNLVESSVNVRFSAWWWAFSQIKYCVMFSRYYLLKLHYKTHPKDSFFKNKLIKYANAVSFFNPNSEY